MGDTLAAYRAEASLAERPARLAEATALLGSTADMALGVPVGSTLRTTLAALRIAELLDLDAVDRRALYYYCMVRLLGCTVGSSQQAAHFGNEFDFARVMAPATQGSQREMLSTLTRAVSAGRPPLQKLRALAGAMAYGGEMRPLMAGHCEVSRMLVADLRLGDAVAIALDQTYERWDGKGMPHGLRGEALSPLTRIVQGAHNALVQDWVAGRERAAAASRERAGHALDPAVAHVVATHIDDVLDAAAVESPWDAALAAEPVPHRHVDDEIDAVALAIACFTDFKFATLAGHSTGVARTAVAAATASGMGGDAVKQLRRAALVHDAGRLAVSTTIWDKPGPLDDDEWEEVRLHAYHTERLLARVPWLAGAARTAALHHERCDGRGYHRACAAGDIPVPARILAAADAYHALIELRPHRPAHSPEAAARVLEEEARCGRLDSDAVQRVLEGAGHRLRAQRRDAPASLTEREVEVLRVLARGVTIKQAATHLHISPKTVDTHVQHIYAKIGCSTRAGAVVFAMREGLLEPVAA